MPSESLLHALERRESSCRIAEIPYRLAAGDELLSPKARKTCGAASFSFCRHLVAIRQAIDEGIPVKGYFYRDLIAGHVEV